MKPLMLSVALATTADLLFRHGQGMRATLAALGAFGHGIGGWVFYHG